MPVIIDIANEPRVRVFTAADLTGSEETAIAFAGGLCLIFRLRVSDHHRFYYIDSGTQGKQTTLPGVLHTVQPIALERYPIYKRNNRVCTLLHTDHFGTLAQTEVGAMMVGKIKNHHASGHAFTRGEEKGWFEFGGSTVVLLTQPGCVVMDECFPANTDKETPVHFGEIIGLKG